MKESKISRDIRLDLGSRPDVRLFRNTRGAIRDPRSGKWITYGLPTGSGDLVGFRSVLITPEAVGMRVPIFTNIEVKAPDAYTEPALLEAQTKFINMVLSFGGLAGFAHSVEEARRIILL